MSNINKLTVSGHLGKDAETKTFENGNSVTRFSLASTRSFKKGDEWHNKVTWFTIIAWNNLSKRAAHYRKGEQVTVFGYIEDREYQDAQGITKTIWEVTAKDLVDNIKISQDAPPLPTGDDYTTKAKSDAADFNATLDKLSGNPSALGIPKKMGTDLPTEPDGEDIPF